MQVTLGKIALGEVGNPDAIPVGLISMDVRDVEQFLEENPGVYELVHVEAA
jgi:hypothetical protein